MDRRSFLMTLIGGMTAASLGGMAVAEAAPVQPAPQPTPEPAQSEEVAAATQEGLDKADAEYSQYYYYRRRPRYYARPRYYRRPRVYYRPRYYARPRYYRRYRRW